MTGLELNNVTLDIRDGATTRRLLDGITLTAAPGEVVGITGPSGSGKSTLLAIAGCLQDTTAGSATLNGTKLTVAGGARLRRERIGIVFQQPNLLPALTVLEQLELMPRLDRILPPSRATRQEAEARALELLDAVGLAQHADRKVSSLSGGQQARVNLARALMYSPELLLVDEPTAALDRENAAQVTELICKMAHQTDAATLYVSHDAAQLDSLDRVVRLVDGKIEEPELVVHHAA